LTDYDLDSGDCLLGQIADATIHVAVVSFSSINVPREQKTKTVKKLIGGVPVLANRVATKIVQLNSDCNVRHVVLFTFLWDLANGALAPALLKGFHHPTCRSAMPRVSRLP
jgi:hypothetical protein